MLIRKTTTADLVHLDAIFDSCRAYMIKEGNPTQWDENYPTSKVVEGDVASGHGYVCVDENTQEILASFALGDYEEQYDHLYAGQWSKYGAYVVVHRMAALPNRGAGQFIFKYLMEHYSYIRIDTHEDNLTMRHILEKLGFTYCGKVYYEGYGERIAFDYQKPAAN